MKQIPYLTYAYSQIQDGNMSFIWGEDQEVQINRRNFLNQHSTDPDDCVIMIPVHKDEIKQVEQNDKGSGIFDQKTAFKIDALLTNQADICLCLLTADCLPIIFFDKKNKVISLGHMGWQGTDLKLAQKIIQKMTNTFRSDPKDIIVIIGPGIHKESYVFTPPVIQEEKPEWQPYLTKLSNGQTSIDIITYNQDQLLAAGITKENINISPINTVENKNFYSHYRSVQTGESEGRFMTIVKISN